MSRKQSKRMAFARRQRRERLFKRILKTHGRTPGFMGVVTRMSITPFGGPTARFVDGALFRVG